MNDRASVGVKVFCGLLAAMPLVVGAVTQIVEIKVEVSVPPCTINGGQAVEIDFGKIGVSKVDGENYQQPFELIYECAGASTDMLLRYLGVVTTFDNAAVQSNIPQLGIRLQQQKSGTMTPFDVGSTLAIPSSQKSSQFIAMPVKKAGVTLQEGIFTAGATLQLEYP
ncbi:fimbrial protein [Serratia sp. 2723]|uniref:fimbrial protein n=1 Tax=unclassified Serratia (in: enterobacteria) TaxID=2647522 RepID=UPI003D1DFB5E